MWVRQVRKKGIRITLQYHDEIAFKLLDVETKKTEVEQKLREAIKEVNDKLKLNVELGVSIDFGYKYSDIH